MDPPSHEGSRFVEVEDATGRSIRVGEWIERADGLWALRIQPMDTEVGRKALARGRRLLPPGNCKYCDELRASSEKHFPAHMASPLCESGRRPHCTCDVCW